MKEGFEKMREALDSKEIKNMTEKAMVSTMKKAMKDTFDLAADAIAPCINYESLTQMEIIFYDLICSLDDKELRNSGKTMEGFKANKKKILAQIMTHSLLEAITAELYKYRIGDKDFLSSSDEDQFEKQDEDQIENQKMINE